MKMKAGIPLITSIMLVTLLFIPHQTQAAFNFEPDRQEWNAWPEHCKARYHGLTQIKNTPYYGEVSEAAMMHWSREIGPKLFVHIHHACAGQIYYKRAMLQMPGAQRDFLLDKAVSGHNYTLRNGSNTNHWYAHFAISLASIYRGLDQHEKAQETIAPLMDIYPEYDRLYMMQALILRDQEQYKEAAAALERGLEESGGGSTELHYFLGLTYLDLEESELAMQHARIAYDGGYPLPGLKRKLSKLGVWDENQI